MTDTRPIAPIASSSRRRALWLGGAAALFVVAAFAMQWRSSRPLRKEPERIRLTCTASATGERAFSGLTAAIVADGWLERELGSRGVGIEWVPVPGASVGPTINEGFANHTIDIASYGDLPSIIANAAGVRTELIVPNGRGTDTYLVVPPDSTARSLLDLKGKTIAIHRGRPWELPFSRLVDSLGLTYADFNVLNLNPQAGAAALTAHKVDALYVNSAYLLVQKGVAKIIWSTERAPADWKMRAEVWGSRDFVARYPELTQIVATAYVRAAHWAAQDEHRDEMLKLLANTGTPVEVLAREYGEGEVWRDHWSPLFDPPVLLHYKNAIQYARQTNMIAGDLDFRDCYDTQFVTKALAQLGLERYWTPWTSDPVSVTRAGE
jgi:sulfonate transport system substrate-binding protein